VAQRPSYQGIIFPDRAESIKQFSSYRVFLDHWNDLSQALGEKFEGIALRGESRVLAVHGEQGRGKTLFAQQLAKDFDSTRATMMPRGSHLRFDEGNLWHRIAGGLNRDDALVTHATESAECIHIEDDPEWLKSLLPKLAGNRDRNYIIIADNAERSYFRQGLVNLSTSEYLSIQDSPQFLTMVAQKLVHLCRTTMARCLFVAFSNDQSFLLNLQTAVEMQHEGLFQVLPLPVPSAKDKEAIVRINTNRLNGISYWYCLDKAGPEEKRAVFSALSGADSFPASFKAVNNAIRQASPTRIGRPAKKNVIFLVAFGDTDAPMIDLLSIGEIESEEVNASWFKAIKFRSGWTEGILGDARERGLLSSLI